MNEKEELIKNINDSFDIMERINEYEKQIIAWQAKQKGPLLTVKVFVLFIILSILMCGLEKSGIPLFIVFIVFSIFCILCAKISLAKSGKQINEYNRMINEAKNDPVLNWLPMTYRDPVPYAYIMSYVEDMRANNLKEAIELFELEMHRARVEANAKSTDKIRIIDLIK